MATDKTEITGEDGGAIRIELSAALAKIYGPTSGPVERANFEGSPKLLEQGGKNDGA